MYCPKCFDNSLEIAQSGIVQVSINGMQRDTGKVMFNLDKESREEVAQHILSKVEDFFKWYASFQNQEPIQSIQAFTNNFSCQNRCVLPATTQIDVVGHLIGKAVLITKATELATKYGLVLQLKKGL